MSEDLNDIQLVLSGKTERYNAIVLRYQDFVFSLCLKVLKNRQEAEEATQDCFIKAFKKLNSYNHTSKFTTWLYTIAHRTCLDYLRKRKATKSLSNVDHSKPVVTESAQHNLEYKDLQAWLSSALTQLSPIENAIIHYFYLEAYSINEVAKITSKTPSNVKIILFRARKKLQKVLTKTQLFKDFYQA